MKLYEQKQSFFDRFRKRPLNAPWREDAVLFKVHEQWGDSCVFSSYENGLVHGFGDFPRVGDVMVSKMNSGKEGAFLFVRVRHCGNPRDMWTGAVEGLGYVHNLKWPLPKQPEWRTQFDRLGLV